MILCDTHIVEDDYVSRPKNEICSIIAEQRNLGEMSKYPSLPMYSQEICPCRQTNLGTHMQNIYEPSIHFQELANAFQLNQLDTSKDLSTSSISISRKTSFECHPTSGTKQKYHKGFINNSIIIKKKKTMVRAHVQHATNRLSINSENQRGGNAFSKQLLDTMLKQHHQS